MVHPLSIVEDEPVNELGVEGVNVMVERLPMKVRKLFLDSSVEAFNVRIHLGCAWIGVVVRNLEGEQFL